MVAGLDDDPTADHSPQSSTEAVNRTQTEAVINSKASTLALEKQDMFDEKVASRRGITVSRTAQYIDTWFSGWKDTIQRTAGMCWPLVQRKHRPTQRSRRLQQLWKMTTTRRLVTTLARFLHSKSEVVAQIRKRLSGQGEFAIYLDDVQGTFDRISSGTKPGLILPGFCRSYHHPSAILGALRTGVISFATSLPHVPPYPIGSDQKHRRQSPYRVVRSHCLRFRHEHTQRPMWYERPHTSQR